jgi:hypothetical protein
VFGSLAQLTTFQFWMSLGSYFIINFKLAYKIIGTYGIAFFQNPKVIPLFSIFYSPSGRSHKSPSVKSLEASFGSNQVTFNSIFENRLLWI